MNKTIERFKIILLIAVILYVAYLAYINGFIFEGDHWHEQTRCDGNCNRVLHPSYLHLVLFSGTCLALALNIFYEFASFEISFSKIKNNLRQQINEIKSMGPIQFELCFRTAFLVVSAFLFGLLIILYAVWAECLQFVMSGFGEEYPISACYTYEFRFTYVFYRVMAFILLWYFPMVISNSYNFLRFGRTTVTHSDDGNK
tara:strand:- start:1399 stop:1998 length:600 start_codon:yes stop_codon:yes gene_type:complete